MTHSALLAVPLAFGLSLLILTVVLRSGAARYLAMDEPNQRSLHSVATPRVGGIAIIGATLCAWSLLPETLTILAVLVAALAAISYIDDRRGLPVGVRLAGHCAAALALLASGLAGGHGVLVTAALAAYLVWMTNAFNFMDGSDGLAGGMAVIGFSAYGIAAAMVDAQALAGMSFALAAAAAAFLLLNFPPARVFMGDAGSIPLGFLAAALGLTGWRLALWPLWFPLLVFSPFLLDASITLLRRAWCRERFWEAHRDHYYQRLIRMGWGHCRTALAEYVLMLCVAASALVALRYGEPFHLPIFAGWLVIYAAGASVVDAKWRRFTDPGSERE